MADIEKSEVTEWKSLAEDPVLSGQVAQGEPGMVPSGDDLRLDIGWDRFERLVLEIAKRVFGLRGIRFRRYGVPGQAQQGIDLAGREPSGEYTVIQCKDHQTFTESTLRTAVEKYACGHRPFNAHRFVVATSASGEPTQLVEELADLQDEFSDLEIELWGSEDLNNHLRYLADVVARFWTRETAAVFCTGAPPPGIPARPPDLQEQADKILVGPLKTGDVSPRLRQADEELSTNPRAAAKIYGELAGDLEETGYAGHASVLRTKQVEALRLAGDLGVAANLAARLGALAVFHGDRHQAAQTSRLLRDLTSEAIERDGETVNVINRHAELIDAAVSIVSNPVEIDEGLLEVLGETEIEDFDYAPLLVLLLVEEHAAFERELPDGLGVLVDSAIAMSEVSGLWGVASDVTIRLRLARSEFDPAERTELLRLARRHQIEDRYSAIISAREARRCALESRYEEALESWRDAVMYGIHAHLHQDVADWLYAIRLINLRYGPLSKDIEDEHRLAQAIRTSGNGRFIPQDRLPRERTMSASAKQDWPEATLSARRWVSTSVTTGSMCDEEEAVGTLGDLYRTNREPSLAALQYQRAGKVKELEELAGEVGDSLLDIQPLEEGPWWAVSASAALVAAQEDLIDDGAAELYLNQLLGLAERGREGELVDDMFGHLTLSVTRSACALAGRGSADQARHLLDLLCNDVPREPDHYRHTDDAHAEACRDIALGGTEATFDAMVRLLDLAEQGANKALEIAAGPEIAALIVADDGQSPFTDRQRRSLESQAARLAETGHHLAEIPISRIDPDNPAVRARAELALDRILTYQAPESGKAGYGTNLITDSYFARTLPSTKTIEALKRVLDYAENRLDTAINRREALEAARNLLVGQTDEVRVEVFPRAQDFAAGDQQGSLHDELTSEPHPLSMMRINMGSSSLRGHGLRLAWASATNLEQELWVRNEAIDLLASHDDLEVNLAAVVLSQLPASVVEDMDPNLMATSPNVLIQQLGVALCAKNPEKHHEALRAYAQNPDYRVRTLVAETLSSSNDGSGEAYDEISSVLAEDPRYSIRRRFRSVSNRDR